MQLLYGSDGINFRVLDSSAGIDSGVEKNILSYSRYEFVSNYKAYSSVAEEPEAITYVSTNLNNTVSDGTIMVTKSGHMRQYASPSAYFHAFLKEVDADFYKEQFFEIFNYSFISDLEVGSYNNGKIDSYPFTRKTMKIKVLNDEQIKNILAVFFSNEKSGSLTKILVDRWGMEYNVRTREVLATIYRYLPYEFRKRHGFRTYCRSEKGIPARVSFVMFCPTETRQDGSFIDLTDTHPQIPSSVMKKYTDYANYLVYELNDEEREAHFAALSRIAVKGRLSVDDCLNYYVNIGKWMNGRQEQFLPDWIDYIDKNSFRKGPLYDIMIDIIRDRVDNVYYNNYLFNNVLNLYGDKVESLSSLSSRTMRFADCIDTLSIDSARFHGWYLKQQKVTFSRIKKDDVLSYEKTVNNEIRKLRSVNIMCKELDALLATEILTLEKASRALKDDINTKLDEEAEAIGRKFLSFRDLNVQEFAGQARNLFQQIRFPESKDIIMSNVEEWLREHMPSSYNDPKLLAEHKKLLAEFKGMLSPKAYEELNEGIRSEETKIKEALKAKTYTLNRDSILSYYVTLKNDLDSGLLLAKDEVKINLSGKGFSWNAESLFQCIRFMLLPDKEDAFLNLDLERTSFELLAGLDIFDSRHFPYLLNFVVFPENKKPDMEAVLEWFLIKSSPVRVSGFFAAAETMEFDAEETKRIAKAYRKTYKDKGPAELMNFVSAVLDGQKAETGSQEKKTGRFGFFH